jgi:hypothetical protein
MTHEAAEDLFIGWYGSPPANQPPPPLASAITPTLPATRPVSWLVAGGKNPAYDYFPCQHQVRWGLGLGLLGLCGLSCSGALNLQQGVAVCCLPAPGAGGAGAGVAGRLVRRAADARCGCKVRWGSAGAGLEARSCPLGRVWWLAAADKRAHAGWLLQLVPPAGALTRLPL